MRLFASIVALALLCGCGAATSEGRPPDAADEKLQLDSWPPFRAVFQEANFPEDERSAGTVESWEIVYHHRGDWQMVALDGRTLGNDRLPDGTRFTENVDPGTKVSMSSEGLVYTFPDGTSTTISKKRPPLTAGFNHDMKLVIGGKLKPATARS